MGGEANLLCSLRLQELNLPNVFGRLSKVFLDKLQVSTPPYPITKSSNGLMTLERDASKRILFQQPETPGPIILSSGDGKAEYRLGPKDSQAEPLRVQCWEDTKTA